MNITQKLNSEFISVRCLRRYVLVLWVWSQCVSEILDMVQKDMISYTVVWLGVFKKNRRNTRSTNYTKLKLLVCSWLNYYMQVGSRPNKFFRSTIGILGLDPTCIEQHHKYIYVVVSIRIVLIIVHESYYLCPYIVGEKDKKLVWCSWR